MRGGKTGSGFEPRISSVFIDRRIARYQKFKGYGTEPDAQTSAGRGLSVPAGLVSRCRTVAAGESHSRQAIPEKQTVVRSDTGKSRCACSFWSSCSWSDSASLLFLGRERSGQNQSLGGAGTKHLTGSTPFRGANCPEERPGLRAAIGSTFQVCGSSTGRCAMWDPLSPRMFLHGLDDSRAGTSVER